MILANKITERFDYLQGEQFETEYGVSGLVKEEKAKRPMRK